jgi:hypothetical protein
MLTGIDRDALPVHPPVFNVGTLGQESEMSFHISLLRDGSEVDTLSDWQALLADNGYRLRFHDEQPSGWSIVFVFYPDVSNHEKVPGHVLVANGDERIDPAGNPLSWLEFAWVTIEEL